VVGGGWWGGGWRWWGSLLNKPSIGGKRWRERGGGKEGPRQTYTQDPVEGQADFLV